MWVLSLTILTLVSTIWFRDRKVEPPIIGLCASLLFALPAVRNTQPDSPPIGMTMDVGGFFFNMAIVAFSAFLAMLNYIYRYRREKPAPPASAPAPILPPSTYHSGDDVKIHVEPLVSTISEGGGDAATAEAAVESAGIPLLEEKQDVAETATLLDEDKTK